MGEGAQGVGALPFHGGYKLSFVYLVHKLNMILFVWGGGVTWGHLEYVGVHTPGPPPPS